MTNRFWTYKTSPPSPLGEGRGEGIRKIIFKITLIIFGCILFHATTVNAQCDDEDFMDLCAEKLGDFTFVKANKIKLSGTTKDGKAPTVEYPFVLSKSSTYVLTACYPGPGNMIVELFDRDHKFIMSNYDKSQKKYYPTINFVCSATGVYYLVYSFANTENACGIGMIGFK